MTNETFAERTARLGKRDDEHMIFEYFQCSQYCDGSILNCNDMKTYTAQEVVGGKYEAECQTHKLTIMLQISIRRNAKAALKDGVVRRNLAPAYLTSKMVLRELPTWTWFANSGGLKG